VKSVILLSFPHPKYSEIDSLHIEPVEVHIVNESFTIISDKTNLIHTFNKEYMFIFETMNDAKLKYAELGISYYEDISNELKVEFKESLRALGRFKRSKADLE